MGREHHLEVDNYVRTLEGRQRPSVLALLVHRHLRETCDDCRREWELLGGDQEGFLQLLRSLDRPVEGSGDAARLPAADLPDSHLPAAGSPAAAEVEGRLERLRERRAKARREVAEILRTPPEAREDKLRNAYSRFSSRSWVELMLEESRDRVRTDPAEARHLLALAVPVLEARCRRREAPAWAPRLLARCRAHLANAERIAGDLPAAARRFAELRRDLAAHPSVDPELNAEILSLEASLRLAQRRFDDAEVKLTLAALLHRQAGDDAGLGRTLIKRANLSWTRGDAAVALRDLETAGELLQAKESPYLFLTMVTGRVLALCELEEFGDADRLLRDHLDLFEASDDLHTGATLRGLQGRVALGLGDHAAAEEAFASCRDAFLTLGRDYDAALASLDLAHALVAAGRSEPLRHLASSLLTVFGSSDVGRETLAVLRLVARKVAEESLSETLIHRLRERLREAGPERPLAATD